MLTRLYNFLAVASIAAVLSLAALFGFLVSTGKLTAERFEMLADVLRGGAAEAVPAEAEVPADDQERPRAESAEEVRQQRRTERLARAGLERAMSDLEAQRELLDQVLHDVMTRQESLVAEQAAWQADQQKLRQETLDRGLEREVTYVSGLPSKLAKEHVILTWQENRDDALRLLNALRPSKTRDILRTFKEPEEVKVMHELLERLRNQGSEESTPGSGTTAGDE